MEILEIYPNMPECNIFAKAILSKNGFVRVSAKHADLSFAVVRYRLFFIKEDINLLLEKITRLSKKKFEPIMEKHVVPVVKSPIIQKLQYRLMRLILLSEKFERFLERKLSRKTRLTLLTLLFCITFGFLFLSSFGLFPKNYALTRVRNSHSRFRRYAFIAMERDSYVNGLIILNTALYIIQGMCLVGVITPSTPFKRGLDSATVGSTFALATQVKLSEKITTSRYGPLVQSIQQPEINIPLGLFCAFGFYMRAKTMDNSNLISSSQLFLNEIDLFEQIRGNLLNLPTETKVKIEYVARKLYAQHLYPLGEISCGNLRVKHTLPFFEDQYLRCVHDVYKNVCKQTPACQEFGKDVLSVIKAVVKKENYEFGGAANVYSAPHIRAVSMINLFAWNQDPEVTGFSEITENLQVLSWLRRVKLLAESSDI